MAKKKAPSRSEVWSFFTGAMGLDLGLERAGIHSTLAVEVSESCCATIRENRPSLNILETDINSMNAAKLMAVAGNPKEVFLMVGGPPCQSFCPGGKRAALSDPRGNLIYAYLRLIKEVRPKYFVFENVANIVTAAIRHRPISERPGKKWNLSEYTDRSRSHGSDAPAMEADEMSGSAIRQVFHDMSEIGYHINFAVLDAADFGAPQHRLRFVMIGSKERCAPAMPTPDHGPRSWRTVRDAIYDLRSDPGPHSVYTPSVERYFSMIPPGGNWRDLPSGLQREALGHASFVAGGGKTGFFRRLAWERPAPTITGRANRKGSALCHPGEVRPLSVRECARLQGFNDKWLFAGSMSDQYLQVGNAVPVNLGDAIGRAILGHESTSNSRASESMETMLMRAVNRLRQAACNKRTIKKRQDADSSSLFPSGIYA